MIPIQPASDHLLGDRMYDAVRERMLHVVCPALTGKRQSYAYRFLSDILNVTKIEECCRMVNDRIELGSTWPKRYVSLLPVPPYKKGEPDWKRIFTDMFQVHLDKDQSFTILVILDKGAYLEPAVLLSELGKVASVFAWPEDRKKPFVYVHVDA